MKHVVVLDFSATSPWFIPDEHSGYADRILADSTSGKTMMLLTDLWWYETANVLAVCVRRRRLDQEQAQKLLFLLKLEIPKGAVSSDMQGQHGILSSSLDTGLSAYKSAYLHLALSTGSELITSDRDFLKPGEAFDCISSLEEY
jgi:predicted nucleic acid-binding protein